MGVWEDGYREGWNAGFQFAFTDDAARVQTRRDVRAASSPVRAKRTRAPSAYNKRLGRAIKRLNKRAKKKDGDYRKGWSRSKVFKMAHKEARKK